jgi:hypothetical protein
MLRLRILGDFFSNELNSCYFALTLLTVLTNLGTNESKKQ